MTTRLTLVAALVLGLAGGLLGARFAAAPQAHAQPASAGANPERLNILWTSGDPEVAHRVGLMYTHAARQNGWFPEVRLIIWGPSQRLLVADKDIQARIAAMRESGVVVEACIACANSYGIVENLRSLGLEVKPMGGPLSDILKNGEHLVTF